MKSLVTTSLALFFHTLGFALGCGIWALIGYSLGSILCHAPVSGALTGLAYQLWSYIYLHDQMWQSIERAKAKFDIAWDLRFGL